jgi:hypothetical protein
MWKNENKQANLSSISYPCASSFSSFSLAALCSTKAFWCCNSAASVREAVAAVDAMAARGVRSLSGEDTVGADIAAAAATGGTAAIEGNNLLGDNAAGVSIARLAREMCTSTLEPGATAAEAVVVDSATDTPATSCTLLWVETIIFSAVICTDDDVFEELAPPSEDKEAATGTGTAAASFE